MADNPTGPSAPDVTALVVQALRACQYRRAVVADDIRRTKPCVKEWPRDLLAWCISCQMTAAITAQAQTIETLRYDLKVAVESKALADDEYRIMLARIETLTREKDRIGGEMIDFLSRAWTKGVHASPEDEPDDPGSLWATWFRRGRDHATAINRAEAADQRAREAERLLDSLEAAIERTREYIRKAMRPISVREACYETAYDRAQRAGLQHGLNALDAEVAKIDALAARAANQGRT